LTLVRSTTDPDWRVAVDGVLTTATFASEAAAKAYLEDLESGRRRPQFDPSGPSKHLPPNGGPGGLDT
jgi:hypothetical protein